MLLYVGSVIATYALIFCIIEEFKKQGESSMNIVEKLLKMDAGKIENPTKVITINAKKLKGAIDFPCKAVDAEKYAEIQEGALEIRKGDVKKINMYKMKTLIIFEGCPEVFKSKEVMSHFGVPTPPELLRKLLLSGEIDDLYNGINELSGYEKDDEDEEEIKN
jgi:hypothetical protein